MSNEEMKLEDEIEEEEEEKIEVSSESEQKELHNINKQIEIWTYYTLIAGLFSHESLWLSSLNTLLKIGFSLSI